MTSGRVLDIHHYPGHFHEVIRLVCEGRTSSFILYSSETRPEYSVTLVLNICDNDINNRILPPSIHNYRPVEEPLTLSLMQKKSRRIPVRTEIREDRRSYFFLPRYDQHPDSRAIRAPWTPRPNCGACLTCLDASPLNGFCRLLNFKSHLLHIRSGG